MISLFAMLIGPVNYYLLAKCKRQGFLVVTHDVRGRYKSEGTFEPFFTEGADVAHPHVVVHD